MSDVAASTQVLIYRVDSEAVTAAGQGSLVDPQVVVLHRSAVDALADELSATAASGPVTRVRVKVISEGAVLVTDGTLGLSEPPFGPEIPAVGLDVGSAAPLADLPGWLPGDLSAVGPTDDEDGNDDGPLPDGAIRGLADAVRQLALTASAAEPPFPADDVPPGRPWAPADLVGSAPAISVGGGGRPQHPILARTVSPWCRLFPWLPFC